MKIVTLNTVIKSFESFATNHKQLNSFYSGESWDFQAQTNLYPALIIAPSPALISRGSIQITFRVLILDLCNRDNSNVDEILSDTLQIFGDLFAHFRDNEDLYGFTILGDAISPEPVEEAFDDITAGWFAPITIEYLFNASDCVAPINNII